MATRPGQFFIITAVLISGVILAVSTITPTYYISQRDQTLQIGLITDFLDGVTESGLAVLDIGNKAKLNKMEKKLKREIFDTISRLRYNDVTVSLNAVPNLEGNVTGKVNLKNMPLNPPIFDKVPATLSAVVDYTLSSPSFSIHYFSTFDSSLDFSGSGASKGIFLEVLNSTHTRLTLPLFYTVNGVPYDNAAFAIGDGKKKNRDAVITITDIEQKGNGLYDLTIEYTTGPTRNDETIKFILEIYTARGARTDLEFKTD